MFLRFFYIHLYSLVNHTQHSSSVQMYVVAGAEALTPGSPLVAAVRTAAQELRGDVLVLICPLTPGEETPLISTFDLDASEMGLTVVGAHVVRAHRFKCELDSSVAAATAEALLACGRAILDNTAPRIFSSRKQEAVCALLFKCFSNSTPVP